MVGVGSRLGRARIFDALPKRHGKPETRGGSVEYRLIDALE
jgi:hypothetical protein